MTGQPSPRSGGGTSSVPAWSRVVDAAGDLIEPAMLLELLLEALPAAAFWKDAEGRFVGGNQAFAANAGVADPSELVGRDDRDFWPAEDADRYRADDAEVLATGEAKVHIEEPMTREDGTVGWIETNKVPLRDPSGRVIGLLGTFHDVTERVAARQSTERRLRTDGLTGIPNRRALLEALAERADDREACWGGLLFIDLDRFKDINDTLGHAVGDQLLRAVSQRLASEVADVGLFARLGGDEFALLVHRTEPDPTRAREQLEDVADTCLEAVRRPFEVQGNTLHVGASIGITHVPPRGVSPSARLQEADLAMYAAKRVVGDARVVYDRRMRDRAERAVVLERRAREALATGAFTLAYQPQVDPQGTVVGVEALLRWTDDELGVVSPFEVVRMAERTGLIHDLGALVAHRAFAAAARWNALRAARDPDARPLTVAINLSGVQFQDDGLADRLRATAEAVGARPEWLHLEFTESVLIASDTLARPTIERLRAAGFVLVLDDFGTGYSSLSYLHELPLSVIKVDRSFVRSVDAEPRRAGIVRAIATLADHLDLTVVAEGVETAAEHHHVLAAGCDLVQGHHTGRPGPMGQLEDRVVGPAAGRA